MVRARLDFGVPGNLSLNTTPKGLSLSSFLLFSFSYIFIHGGTLPPTLCPTAPHSHSPHTRTLHADSKGRSPFLRVVMAGRKKLTQ